MTGHARGLEELVASFHPFVEAGVRLHLGRRRGAAQEVEEVAREVWADALRRVGPLPRGHERILPLVPSLGGALAAAAEEACTRRLRATMALPGSPRGRAGEAPRPQRRPAAVEVTELVERARHHGLRADVARSLDRLPDTQLDVLLLRVIERRPVFEVAQMLELRPAVVELRCHRALSALRRRLPPSVRRELSALRTREL